MYYSYLASILVYMAKVKVMQVCGNYGANRATAKGFAGRACAEY